jgi:uncharacterized membrane protein YecN with MAPEG domain
MHYVHLVATLALFQLAVFTYLVARARTRYGVPGPATTGHAAFEREYRVHMNTVEQLVLFLPALFLAAQYWPPGTVAVVGSVYLVGRVVFRQRYVSRPRERGIGFLLTVIPTLALLLAALVGIVIRISG